MSKKAKRRRRIIEAVNLLIGFIILCLIALAAAVIMSYALRRFGVA